LKFDNYFPDISLAPNDEVYLSPVMTLEYENIAQSKENFDYMNSDKWDGIDFQIGITYANKLDNSLKYRIISGSKISLQRALITKNESEDVKEGSGKKPNLMLNTDLIRSWGVSPPNKIKLVVNTNTIREYNSTHYVYGACRALDYTLDMLDDKNIIISSPFRMNSEIKTIEMLMDENFMERLGVGSRSIQCRIFLLPKSVPSHSIKSLSNVKELGGILNITIQSIKNMIKPSQDK